MGLRWAGMRQGEMQWLIGTGGPSPTDVRKGRRETHFLVKGVRECFSYRQCLRYLTQRLHVGMALLHLDLRRRHSLHAWSAKPSGVSRSPKAAPRFRSLELNPASETLMSPPGEELSSMVIRGR